MMGTKERNFRPLPDDLSLESLVPKDNFYRRLQERIDLSFVRELVLPLYANAGRYSIDPVVFFKLQLVLFFENLRSERQLMEVVADRLSLRWYLGYDLDERLPDHSSLTKIRERYGVLVFRHFFERIVEMCVEAGLVSGDELFIDSTKVEADAAVDSLAPRWFVEAHLDDPFENDTGEDETTSAEGPSDTQDARRPEDGGTVRHLPTARDEDLLRRNRASEDWISRGGAQDRSFEGTSWRERTADTRASRTDPDATPMRWSENARKLGYQTNYVVDGGKARIILSVLVTPGEVSENRPMLDLLFRSAFRWKIRPHHVTAGGKYGTVENIAAVERSGIRAYLALHEAGGARWLLPQERLQLRCREGSLRLPGRRNIEGSGRPSRHTEPRQDRHLPSEGFSLCRVLPEAALHHQQEWPLSAAQYGRRVRRSGQDLHGDQALPESHKETQGVDRAFCSRRASSGMACAASGRGRWRR
jgi:transposase